MYMIQLKGVLTLNAKYIFPYCVFTNSAAGQPVHTHILCVTAQTKTYQEINSLLFIVYFSFYCYTFMNESNLQIHTVFFYHTDCVFASILHTQRLSNSPEDFAEHVCRRSRAILDNARDSARCAAAQPVQAPDHVLFLKTDYIAYSPMVEAQNSRKKPK